MDLKKLFQYLCFLTFNIIISQEFEVPNNATFNTPQDFKNFELGIVQAYNWLLNTPVNQEPEKRKEVNAFLMRWLEGSPSVTVEINPEIVTFLDCPDCLMIFMGGWTIHTLNNNYDKDPVKGATAGIRGVMDFYQKNREILGKNKAIEKYQKLEEKGKLEPFIADKLK